MEGSNAARASASAGVRPIDTGTVRAHGSSASGRTSTCARPTAAGDRHGHLLVVDPEDVDAGQIAHPGQATLPVGIVRRHDHAQPHEPSRRRLHPLDHRARSSHPYSERR